MTRLLIRGARLLGADAADLLVEDGVIREVGSLAGTAADQTVDADGLVALPGLVDLHVHLREPGREDAETIATGSAAAAAGGFTAVYAMANTSPVTDTAEAAERILDLGLRCGLTDVVPVGAVTKRLAGAELAELGLMARSRARVRVFSDDGHCVHDARVMRRALEYIKTFGGVISQHSQDPRLADSSACCHEGELSGRLGLPGWPGIAEESIVARDVMLARHTGSRVHVAHVSTAGSVEVLRWAKASGHRRHGRGHAAPPRPHDRPARRLRPRLQGQPATAARRGRRGAARRARRRHHRRRRDRPRPARPARQGARLPGRGLRDARPRDGPVRRQRPARGQRPARLGRRRPRHVEQPGPHRSAHLQGQPLEVGAPANITLVDPDREVTVDAAASASRSRNNPWHGRTFRGAVVTTVLRGQITHTTERELTTVTETNQ